MTTQKIYAKLIFLIGLFLLTTKVFSQDPNFHIYICFGQSNMEGQGAIETKDKTVNSRFKVFQSLDCSNLSRNKATWCTAVPPLCQCNTGLSPADYFGRTMVDHLPDSMLTDLSLKADSVPLLAGEVLYGGVYSAMNLIIPKLPDYIPTAHVISAAGLLGDWAHFNSEGYRILGMRYAAKMLSLLGVEAKVLEPEAYNFEAECSTFGSNWNEITDVNASNKSYLTIKPGINNINEASQDSANAVYFTFTAKSDTAFYVYARLNCPTLTMDSFWVKMDDGPFEYINNLTTSVWKWLKLKRYTLNAGNHTFAIANGEEGAKLDKIFISNYDNVPTGMGNPAIRICNNIVHQVPGKIEAELFKDQNGIVTENTGDTGGGLNVGWIDTGDWMEYAVDVASDTVHKVTFRCASQGSGGAVSIFLDGVNVGSITFTGTGAWQTYKSFSKDIPLKAGKHILKLLVTTGGFNMNWFMFEKIIVTGIKDLIEGNLRVFPNPTTGELNIAGNTFQFNNIEIIDCTGKKVYSRSVDPAKRISFNPYLQKGIYILKLSNTTQTQNIKIIIA